MLISRDSETFGFLVRVARHTFAFQMLLASKHLCPLAVPLLIRENKNRPRPVLGRGRTLYHLITMYLRAYYPLHTRSL